MQFLINIYVNADRYYLKILEMRYGNKHPNLVLINFEQYKIQKGYRPYPAFMILFLMGLFETSMISNG